jgi:hypothetical protein
MNQNGGAALQPAEKLTNKQKPTRPRMARNKGSSMQARLVLMHSLLDSSSVSSPPRASMLLC